MPKFALQKVPWLKGRIDFFFLLQNEKNLFEEFIDEISMQGNYDSEIRTLKVRLQEMAEVKIPMPFTKCRDLTPKGDPVKEYELKTKKLRLYLFHDHQKGRIIVMGGKKTSQKKDMIRFRNIKKSYLNDH
jgi:hypothetical protein